MERRALFARAAAFAAALSLLAARPAVAAPSEDELRRAEARFEAGEAFFRSGEYGRALTSYQEAYLLTDEPALLFNMAQCYRLLGRDGDALDTYRRYLERVPGSPYRSEIEAWVDASFGASALRLVAVNTTELTAPPGSAAEAGRPQLRGLGLPLGLAAGGLGLGAGVLALRRGAERRGALEPAGRALLITAAAVADLSLVAAGVTFVLSRRGARVSAALTAGPGGAALAVAVSPGGAK